MVKGKVLLYVWVECENDKVFLRIVYLLLRSLFVRLYSEGILHIRDSYGHSVWCVFVVCACSDLW